MVPPIGPIMQCPPAIVLSYQSILWVHNLNMLKLISLLVHPDSISAATRQKKKKKKLSMLHEMLAHFNSVQITTPLLVGSAMWRLNSQIVQS